MERITPAKEEKWIKTEYCTNGAGSHAEILQFSVIDGEGAVWMNQYFRPKKTVMAPGSESEPHSCKCPILDHKELKLEMASFIVGYNLPDVQIKFFPERFTLPDPRNHLHRHSCSPSMNAILFTGKHLPSRAPNTWLRRRVLRRYCRLIQNHLLLLK